MADELWNQKLTRENIRDFYMSTVVMVYSSCYGITKEATRCENAIVKSYLDIYSNGLSHLSAKMKGQLLFSHMNLVKGERSELAELASRLL